MMEDKPITDLPDLSDLPPDVQEFVRGLAEEGISVILPTLKPGEPLPEPIWLNTSLSDAIIEERDEYGR